MVVEGREADSSNGKDSELWRELFILETEIERRGGVETRDEEGVE